MPLIQLSHIYEPYVLYQTLKHKYLNGVISIYDQIMVIFHSQDQNMTPLSVLDAHTSCTVYSLSATKLIPFYLPGTHTQNLLLKEGTQVPLHTVRKLLLKHVALKLHCIQLLA